MPDGELVCWADPLPSSSQVEFKNCEFVSNSAQNGAGAVSLGDGAIGLFSKVVFEKNSAGGTQVAEGTPGLQRSECRSTCLRAAVQQPNLPPIFGIAVFACPAAYGAGGAVYLTSNAGFTEVSFQGNSAPSGGAVGVGQSSSGIYFNGCTFNVGKTRGGACVLD